MDYQWMPAAEEDKGEVLSLYKAQLGRSCCPWDEDYPSQEEIDWDLSRNALFVLKQNGRIAAAISIEEDEQIASLPCWDAALAPEGELARLAVLPGEQNKGLGRMMLRFGMDELKKRGFRGICFLVDKSNEKAIRSYAVFGFRIVGECCLYEREYLCYEKEL